ncbi:MAG: DNA polymerase III subunit gamma/tau [Rickettsiales bacterium]|jgi:DNA polymerase-3 subunit gamma/tau|nr:DNA polymerase III subunit gamma/tau [Rickettsiales bacterium]
MSNNYTVLARKYRSKTFADLIGQGVLSTTLSNAINSGKLAHGYIFSGIRGTGKTSAARIFARALNCTAQDSPTPTPCGECDNCRAIATGQHMDVMEIDAASHTGVDNIRDVLDSAAYAPNMGRFKIYIIDEAHMLSKAAFNALLKTLEEPPAHVVFMMATTEIRNIPATILSRCQRFDLARVHIDELKAHFLKLAALEKIELSDAAATLIAHAADGSVRDGLSILDQAISQTNGKVDEAAINAQLKRTGFDQLAALVETIFSGNVEDALAKTADMYSGGADMAGLLGDMQDFTYWLTRAKISPDAIRTAPYTENIKTRMIAIAEKTTLNTLSRFWQVMTSSAAEVGSASHPKNSFDMMVVRMMYLADLKPIKTLLQEAPLAPQVPIAPKVPFAGEGVDGAAGRGSGNKVGGISTFPDLLKLLEQKKESLLLAELKGNTEIADFQPNSIKLYCRDAKSDLPTKLRKFLADNTTGQWTIEQLEESTGKQTSTEEMKAAAQDDPVIQDALSMFAGAEISSVKEE